MNLLPKILFVILCFMITYFTGAMALNESSEEPDVIRGNFSVISSETMPNEKGIEVPSEVKNPVEYSKVLPITVNNYEEYSYRDGEYPFQLENLIGCLVIGDNLTDKSVRLYSPLTGDGWKWNHLGPRVVKDGLYFDLETLQHYYTDPMNNFFSAEDMGFDVGICNLALHHPNFQPGEPKKVIFFLRDDKNMKLYSTIDPNIYHEGTPFMKVA